MFKSFAEKDLYSLSCLKEIVEDEIYKRLDKRLQGQKDLLKILKKDGKKRNNELFNLFLCYISFQVRLVLEKEELREKFEKELNGLVGLFTKKTQKVLEKYVGRRKKK